MSLSSSFVLAGPPLPVAGSFVATLRRFPRSWHLLFARARSLEAIQFLLLAPWWLGEVFVVLSIVFPLQQLPLRSCGHCGVPGASLKLSRAGMTSSWCTLDLLCHLHPSLWGSGFHQHFPNLLGQPPFPSHACPSINLGEPRLFLGLFLDCCPDPNLPPPLPFPFSWKQQLRESSLGGGREKTALRADDFSIN